MTDASPAPIEGADARREYPDVVRALGTVAVVTIHVAGSGVSLFGTGSDPAGWWVYNGASSACRWAVPLFVMLSGALLLDPGKEPESAGQFYRKRLARVGPPLVFWSGFYLWLRWFAPGHSPPPLTLEEAIKPLLFANPYYHLYFLFVILGLYLFTPALRVFTANSGAATVRGCAIAVIALACGDTFVRTRYNIPANAFTMGAPYVGYYLLGCGLRDAVLIGARRWLCGAVLVAATAATALGTFWSMSHWQTGGMRQYFYTFFSPTVCAAAVCVFLLLSGSNYTSPLTKALRPVTRLLSDTSFGVYLIHPALLLLAHREGYLADRMAWWLYLPGVTAAVLAASVVLTRLIQATQIGRPLVG